MIPLSQAPKHRKAIIKQLQADEPLEKRFLEMGFVEGAHVMLLHEAPFSKDPLMVRIRNSRIALRRREAECILVELE